MSGSNPGGGGGGGGSYADTRGGHDLDTEEEGGYTMGKQSGAAVVSVGTGALDEDMMQLIAAEEALESELMGIDEKLRRDATATASAAAAAAAASSAADEAWGRTSSHSSPVFNPPAVVRAATPGLADSALTAAAAAAAAAATAPTAVTATAAVTPGLADAALTASSSAAAATAAATPTLTDSALAAAAAAAAATAPTAVRIPAPTVPPTVLPAVSSPKKPPGAFEASDALLMHFAAPPEVGGCVQVENPVDPLARKHLVENLQ